MRVICLVVLAALLTLACGGETEMEIRREIVEYVHEGTILEGELFLPPAADAPRPGVLVVHAWKGIRDHERDWGERLAREGFVVFACDIYGKGIRPETPAEAGAQAGKYRADRALLRARARAGLDVLAARADTDAKRIGAIGFCFGGGTVLELARSGAGVRGVVSLHGNLDTPNPDDAKSIRGKVLVLHGAADPHVPEDQVAAFRAEMDDAGADYRIVAYPDAVHAFSDPGAGNDPSRGAAYDEAAAKKSWTETVAFLQTVLS